MMVVSMDKRRDLRMVRYSGEKMDLMMEE